MLYFLAAMISACAAPLRPVVDQAGPTQAARPVVASAEETPSSPLGSPDGREQKKDEGLFLQAMHQIEDAFNKGTFTSARQTLGELISSYPQSKWADAAQAALRLMGEVDTYRQRLPIAQDMVQKLTADKNRTLQDNERIKKELRLLSEKYPAELAELQQENEQLKKDLQLLKNLEMQLDRREKTLR